MLLKMGLFLVNIYGRISWYMLVQSVLYTWEVAFKYRKPEIHCHNIYYEN